ncbi:MAG: ribonuclease Z [Nitrospirae bacterium]|nr:ribonuclease Z [Nitrospirota bacterium]
MKPTFIHRLINGPFEDPCLFVRIIREKRAFLFDIGSIERLKSGDLQKITDVFVTHTHIDHFIGFDTLLRALLRRERPLRIYGPSNITECIEGKLRGYTWNLIREYPLKIEVLSVKEDKMVTSSFYAENCFEKKQGNIFNFDGVILKEPFFRVNVAQLDHQIPCLAFSLEEDFHININKAVLIDRGLPVGPWLAELKKAIREQKSGDTEFVINGGRYSLNELKDIVKITKGQKISYVTDVSLTEENIRKVIELVHSSDTLYCEAYFLEKDRDRALERFHLTAKTAGMIAREARVGNFVAMHFSPKYRSKSETPEDEAIREFKMVKKCALIPEQH